MYIYIVFAIAIAIVIAIAIAVAFTVAIDFAVVAAICLFPLAYRRHLAVANSASFVFCAGS